MVYFGPDLQWEKTWATAGSWKSAYVKRAWAGRKPDGTHPWDPFAGDGSWTTIAYRPPHIQGDKNNPQMWIDYLAPSGKSLVYRVVAVNSKDDDQGASEPTPAVTLGTP